MSRLQRSVEGFSRRVQMSRKRLFLVVEGRAFDAHFYGSLAETLPDVDSNVYEVWVIDQIAGLKNAAGKRGVLELYERCRAQGVLRQRNRSGERSIVFCVDRDLDGATGRMRRSSHVMYTCHYNVEAEIVIHGRDDIAVARSLSLSPEEGRWFASHLGNWVRELAEAWSDWIELYVIDAGLRAGTGATPARPSAINDDLYGPVSALRRASALSAIRRRAALANPRREQFLRSRCRNIAATHGPETLLNGKHLPAYFEYRAREHFDSQPVAVGGCSGQVLHCYLGALDYSAPWAEHYRAVMRVHLA